MQKQFVSRVAESLVLVAVLVGPPALAQGKPAEKKAAAPAKQLAAVLVTYECDTPYDQTIAENREWGKGLTKVPGLISKTWLNDDKTAGGFSAFTDRASAEAFIQRRDVPKRHERPFASKRADQVLRGQRRALLGDELPDEADERQVGQGRCAAARANRGASGDHGVCQRQGAHRRSSRHRRQDEPLSTIAAIARFMRVSGWRMASAPRSLGSAPPRRLRGRRLRLLRRLLRRRRRASVPCARRSLPPGRQWVYCDNRTINQGAL
jgi:hypothetical protein